MTVTVKDTDSFSSSFQSSTMVLDREAHTHARAHQEEEQTPSPEVVVEFETAAAAAAIAMFKEGDEAFDALVVQPPLSVSSPRTASVNTGVEMEDHDDDRKLWGTTWSYSSSSSIPLSSLLSSTNPTKTTTMPMMVALRTALAMTGIFLLIFRRFKRKWKKAVRVEKIRRLDHQEEALRHKLLLKTMEKERDYLKRKLKSVQLDNEMLEQQIEELGNQRQDLYDTLEVMSRLSPSYWSQQLQHQQHQQQHRDDCFFQDKELDGGNIDDDISSNKKHSTKTNHLLTTPTEYHHVQEQHDNDDDDQTDEAIVAGASAGVYDEEDDVDNQSRVSASSRSTLVTEPISPPTINKGVKNLTVPPPVKCLKVVA